MAFVSLGAMPNPRKLRVSTIQNLRGGLNIHDTPWHIKQNQSPNMQNLWWEDGALRTRPGLTAYNNGLIVDRNSVEPHNFSQLQSTGFDFLGWHVICNEERRCFTAVATRDLDYFVDVKDAEGKSVFPVGHMDGRFFAYDNTLYFKSVDGYYKIYETEAFDVNAGAYTLRAENVEGFIPTVLINAVPIATNGENMAGGGDFYQPKNRLSYWRKITYNCKADTRKIIVPEEIESIGGGGAKVEVLQADGSWKELAIPTGIVLVDRTMLDFTDGSLGAALEEAGTAMLTNNVRVTYKIPALGENKIMYDSIMDCNIVTVFNGSVGTFVIMAGYSRQPNAYFWNGNTNLTVDPTYFPVENYNLSGDISDPIVGFGRQQYMLVIFQTHQIGRCTVDIAKVDGRDFVSLNYTTINPYIGCDFPESIQLIENNLVFANKRRGILFLKDSSSAHENNVVSISRNVEKPEDQRGILYDLSRATQDSIRSFDDGSRYYLFTANHAWVWDYTLGYEVNQPETVSWFYFDNIPTPACMLAGEGDEPVYIGRDGYMRRFVTTVQDKADAQGVWLERGQDFEKVLTLPIQDFNTYEVLKDVDKCIFVMQGSGNNVIDIEYETDYRTTKDKTPLFIPGKSWLVPRDLSYRSLRFITFAVTAVRRPRCIHVRHFKLTLKNNKRGDEISFVSAQIFYKLGGADR